MIKFLNKSIACLLLFMVWATQTVAIAQTSGLPAPSVSPLANSTAASALFASLTGCTTSNYVFVPQSGTCVAQSGSGIPYPSGSGIPIVSGGTAWGTTIAAPAGTVVGTSDTQTLTNKSIAGSEVNSGNIAPSINASSEVVSFSATPTFSLTTRYSTITLTANITSFTLASGTAGQEKTLTFCQNGTGSYTVTGPSNVHGFMTIGSTASKCSSQHFNYDSGQTAWLADGGGVINE